MERSAGITFGITTVVLIGGCSETLEEGREDSSVCMVRSKPCVLCSRQLSPLPLILALDAD